MLFTPGSVFQNWLRFEALGFEGVPFGSECRYFSLTGLRRNGMLRGALNNQLECET